MLLIIDTNFIYNFTHSLFTLSLLRRD